MTNNQYLATYGAEQAVPGPLFAFAANLGAVIGRLTGRWRLGRVGTVISLFVVSATRICAARRGNKRRCVVSISAVVGLLLAALYPSDRVGLVCYSAAILGRTGLAAKRWRTKSMCPRRS